MEDQNIKPVVEYQGSHPNKAVVGTIEGRIYFTTRTPEHYFRIFAGYGLSTSVYNKLTEEGVSKVVMTIVNRGVIRYLLTDLKDWINAGYYTNLIEVNGELMVDPQFVMAESDMKEIKESDLKDLKNLA